MRRSWKVSIALVLSVFASAACSSGTATEVGSAPNPDRTNVEDVANAFVTSFLLLDFDTMRDLTLPEQRGQLDQLVETLRAVPQPDTSVESVRPEATIIDQHDDLALVEYRGRYCLAEASVDVSTTVIGTARSVGSDEPATVVVPEQCFDIDDVFPGGPAEYQRIDGRWFAPLPE